MLTIRDSQQPILARRDITWILPKAVKVSLKSLLTNFHTVGYCDIIGIVNIDQGFGTKNRHMYVVSESIESWNVPTKHYYNIRKRSKNDCFIIDSWIL